jgi:hypothetical protein
MSDFQYEQGKAMRTIRSRGALLATAAIPIVVFAFGAVYLVRAHQQTQGSLGAPNSGAYPGLHGQITPECPGNALTTEDFPAILAHTDCTPSFTAQDVRDYLARGFSMGKIGVVGKPTVSHAVFLTIRELEQVTGESEWAANYPGNLLICYVGLSGAFRFASPPMSHPVVINTASIVVDAHTGNGFVMSTGDALAGHV